MKKELDCRKALEVAKNYVAEKMDEIDFEWHNYLKQPRHGDDEAYGETLEERLCKDSEVCGAFAGYYIALRKLAEYMDKYYDENGSTEDISNDWTLAGLRVYGKHADSNVNEEIRQKIIKMDWKRELREKEEAEA